MEHLIKPFDRNTLHSITQEATAQYMREKYEIQLLQIQLAAEDRQYSTVFDAEDCPPELVAWLFEQNFTIYYHDKWGNRVPLAAVSDYPYNGEGVKTIILIW